MNYIPRVKLKIVASLTNDSKGVIYKCLWHRPQIINDDEKFNDVDTRLQRRSKMKTGVNWNWNGEKLIDSAGNSNKIRWINTINLFSVAALCGVN